MANTMTASPSPSSDNGFDARQRVMPLCDFNTGTGSYANHHGEANAKAASFFRFFDKHPSLAVPGSVVLLKETDVTRMEKVSAINEAQETGASSTSEQISFETKQLGLVKSSPLQRKDKMHCAILCTTITPTMDHARRHGEGSSLGDENLSFPRSSCRVCPIHDGYYDDEIDDGAELLLSLSKSDPYGSRTATSTRRRSRSMREGQSTRQEEGKYGLMVDPTTILLTQSTELLDFPKDSDAPNSTIPCTLSHTGGRREEILQMTALYPTIATAALLRKSSLTQSAAPIPLVSLVVRICNTIELQDLPQMFREQHDYEDDNMLNQVRENPLLLSWLKRDLIGRTIAMATTDGVPHRHQHINETDGPQSFCITCLHAPMVSSHGKVERSLCVPVRVMEAVPRYNINTAQTANPQWKFYTVFPSTNVTILGSQKQKSSSSSPHNDISDNEDREIGDETKEEDDACSKRSNNNPSKESFYHASDSFGVIVCTMQLVQELILQRNNWENEEYYEDYDISGNSNLSNKMQGGQVTPDIPRTFLLSGPPGVGKTFAVKRAISFLNQKPNNNSSNTQPSSISSDLSINSTKNGKVRLISIRGSELVGESGGILGTIEKLDTIFVEAATFEKPKHQTSSTIKHQNIMQSSPLLSIIFLDEFDALATSSVFVQGKLNDLLDRVSQGVTTTSEEEHASNETRYIVDWRRVVVIAATNRPQALESSLRRPGRFDKELIVTPPNVEERVDILTNMLKNVTSSFSLELPEPSSLRQIAEACVGYVAADLAALVRRAEQLMLEAHQKGQLHTGTTNILQLLVLSMKDVGASALRDAALSAPPKSTWDDIAGDAGGAKTALRRAVEWPRTKRHMFERLGLTPPRGVLLYGPPGCAKTSLARAAAGSAGIAFVSLSPADVYESSYVGEAEAVVRRVFALARAAAPCLLFFDEIDSILGTSGGESHGMGRSSSTSSEARVLSTFLNEMDGIDTSTKDGVLVLGATNRPTTLDAALLRPGRFDHVIYVPLPDLISRRAILQKMWNQIGVSQTELLASSSGGMQAEELLNYLASDSVSGGFTGAEMVNTCQEAAMATLRTYIQRKTTQNNEFQKSSVDHNEENIPPVTPAVLEEAFRKRKPMFADPKSLLEYQMFQQDKLHHKQQAQTQEIPAPSDLAEPMSSINEYSSHVTDNDNSSSSSSRQVTLEGVRSSQEPNDNQSACDERMMNNANPDQNMIMSTSTKVFSPRDDDNHQECGHCSSSNSDDESFLSSDEEDYEDYEDMSSSSDSSSSSSCAIRNQILDSLHTSHLRMRRTRSMEMAVVDPDFMAASQAKTALLVQSLHLRRASLENSCNSREPEEFQDKQVHALLSSLRVAGSSGVSSAQNSVSSRKQEGNSTLNQIIQGESSEPRSIKFGAGGDVSSVRHAKEAAARMEPSADEPITRPIKRRSLTGPSLSLDEAEQKEPRISTEAIPADLGNTSRRKRVSAPELWRASAPSTNPSTYLKSLLNMEGISSVVPKSAFDLRQTLLITRSSEQKLDDQQKWYTVSILNVVRSGDMKAIRRLHEQDGHPIQCANPFGESTLHLACRRSHLDVIKYMIEELNVNVNTCDDCGRTPMHDSFWSPNPAPHVVKFLLETSPDLLFVLDKRNNTPLDYVREEHWALWCTFLEENRSLLDPKRLELFR